MVRRSRKDLADVAPRTNRDRVFCDGWLRHFDHVRAYRDAGFRGTPRQISGRARAKLERFAPYLIPLQQAKAQIVAEKLVVNQEQVLQTMALIAELLPMVGEDFARFLGFSSEEIAAANAGRAVTTEQGVGDA